MSWSSPVRLLGVCGLWFSVLTGCGGNPEVGGGSGGSANGGSGGSGGQTAGTAGSFVIDTAGEGPDGEGGGANPVNAVCGNKELEPGEFCDDGNTTDDDGCSADCTVTDPDFDCSMTGEPCVQVVICGNDVLEGDELCDDGNTVADDGCAADCSAEEEGWVCIRPGTPCVAVSVCGNGVRERGEQCDDNDAVADDGCDAQCQIEPSWYCPIPGQDCAQQVCGNGTRTPDEGCDDNNVTANDGCSPTCTVEAGWHCNLMGCKSECGDGMVVTGEECDDGDAIGGDGCSSGCKEEPFYSCNQAEPSVCGPVQNVCGNGELEPIFNNQGVITGHEICDPPGGADGCLPGCTSVDLEAANPPVCGDGDIEGDETCDDGDMPPAGNDGCSASCTVEAGWTCTPGTACTRNPFCGDNVVDFAQGEACDDGDGGTDGCSGTCQVQPGWFCSGLGPSVCIQPTCGNGVLEGSEQCDDHNTGNSDGCSSTCTIQMGWACPTVNAPCIPRCGDGTRVGAELLAGRCDDGDTMSGDGCNAGCKIEPGYKCPGGTNCVESVCGDGVLDTGEGCDPTNTSRCIGGTNPGVACNVGSNTCTGGGTCQTVAGDGCGATCQIEPTVTRGTNPDVDVFCGDGLVTGTEECDDGNDDNLDGCDEDCLEEDGWGCTEDLDLPSSLQMRVRYRDFKAGNASSNDGHTDFQYQHLDHFAGITGLPCTSTNQATCGRLNTSGKPALVIDNQVETGIRNADTFGLWYTEATANTGAGGIKNHLGNNIAIQAPFVTTLTLTQTPAGSETYVYNSNGNNFYPFDTGALNGQGYGDIGNEVALCNNGGGVTNVTGQPACDNCDATCRGRNYSFTTELRYYFQYKGGETLSFIGDDDVWVYINGRLAVDMGGLHGEENGQVVLGDDGTGGGVDSNCSKHSGGGALPNVAACYTATEQNDDIDSRFSHYDAMGNVIAPFEKGGVYEIVLFHAERHTGASNFKLTLAGFLAPRSFCEPVCGDGVVVGDEACDDGPPPNGNSNTIAGRCNTTCTARLYCGDGVKQTGEACDDGTNTDLYTSGMPGPNDCAPGCNTPAWCGDDVVQSGFNEKCDDGAQNNNSAYSPGCKLNCTFGGYCGDNIVNGNETCDRGINNGKEYGATSCSYDCLPGARCGDGVITNGEQCDDSANNGMPDSNCTASCTVKPYCGDGIPLNSAGEECDWGPFAVDPPEYGGCSTMCTRGPYCGDGDHDEDNEECDNGASNNNSTYDGCNLRCALGPRCGDGVLQMSEGEACDNGFNEDDYNDPKTAAMECGEGCTPPPYCGDGVLQSAYELCDEGGDNNDATYEGCTTLCEFGPYCGDGDINGNETCDDGLDNVSYEPTMGGCGYDCQPAPWCGDGTRNGPEQCDLGAGQNNGDYGTCNMDCTFAPYCGDGVRQAPEECDEGGVSQSCSATCKKRVVVQ